MKSIYSWIPSLIIANILLCISITAFAASDSPVATKNDSAIIVETLSSTDNQQTIRLFPFDQIPDSAQIRAAIASSWFSDPIDNVIKRKTETYTDSKGYAFTVSGKYAEDIKDNYAISIIPALTDYDLPNRNLVPQGTWILYRNLDTGSPTLIKIYPRENPALSISIHPAAQKAHTGKSFIDVCLFNAYVCKDIAIGVPFETLYYLSLSRLKEQTEAVIPWNLFDPPRYNSPVKAMSEIIAGRTYRLVYLEDGCFDHNGKPVHISNLQPQTEFEINAAMNIDQIQSEVSGGVDSAGFAKWIIDGIIRPVAGQGTIIESLKRSTEVPKTHFTKPYLDKVNIFFGLDWIRNLGSAALSLNLNRTVYPDDSGLDVTVCPFALTNAASTASEKAAKQPAFLGYQQYAGYQTSYLVPILYYLAIGEPGHFYLACLSRGPISSENRVYNQIAVFFPYFDQWGEFHLDIYEDGALVPVSTFIENNKDTYTALVRVRAPEKGLFNP